MKSRIMPFIKPCSVHTYMVLWVSVSPLQKIHKNTRIVSEKKGINKDMEWLSGKEQLRVVLLSLENRKQTQEQDENCKVMSDGENVSID